MSEAVKVRGSRSEDEAAALSDQSLLLPGEWERKQRISKAGGFTIPVGIHWVERDVHDISETVARLFPNLRVASCVCGNCVPKGHFPHVVVELGKDGKSYPVFGFKNFGSHVIERIRSIHVSQEPNKRSIKNNQKIRDDARKKAREKQQEGLEIVEAALKSPKFDWKGPDGLRTEPLRTKI